MKETLFSGKRTLFATVSTNFRGFPGGSVVKNPPASAGDAKEVGSIPGSGRSPGKGNVSPLQYSCLENPVDSLVGYSSWLSCKDMSSTGHNWVTKQALIFFNFYFFISWRLITLQYCSGFCHTLKWISHGFTYVPHPDSPSHLPLYPTPLGLPSAPGKQVLTFILSYHFSYLWDSNVTKWLSCQASTERRMLLLPRDTRTCWEWEKFENVPMYAHCHSHQMILK